MTNKQIIIDGVNITGCTWCDFEPDAEPYCRINDGEDLACEDNPNCYFKQLARKTQECEKLKKQLMQKSEVDMFFNTPIEGWSNDPCGICPHKAENEELLKENQQLRNSLSDSLMFKFTGQENETDRYRKALDEIEKELKEDIYCESQECGCDDFEECLRCTKNKILDIINKAKGEINE